MKRVAVFGNTGAGKSTLARRLAELTGIPLFPLDLIQWRPADVKADTLVYIDLPLVTHAWWVTKRLLRDYRKLVADARGEKRVHHLKSAAEIAGFVQAVAKETT